MTTCETCGAQQDLFHGTGNPTHCLHSCQLGIYCPHGGPPKCLNRYHQLHLKPLPEESDIPTKTSKS
jgi:hypothetical protein